MKMLKTALYILLAVIVCAGCAGNASTKETPEKKILEADMPTYRKLSQSEIDSYSKEITLYVNKLLGNSFSGAILVAKNGEVLFEEYHGNIDRQAHTPITENTPFHLASISKTFTGTTVLHLWEQGRLSLDDSLQKYFPQLPYRGITVRMLLSHRSGLPNYLNFLDSNWSKRTKATNEDVLNYMIKYKPAIANLPNKAFNYCNTNFVLLALVIEKITRMPFPVYMKDSVFTPLGLNHTFVFSPADTVHYVPTYVGNRPYLMDHLDCTYGDKNIYSTTHDLLAWDKALYEHRFVKAATLDSAYRPLSNERPSMHNYGLAWRLFINNGDTIIYHNGKWHGSNTVFTRLVKDSATIIVLGNSYNRNIYRAREIANVFSGQAHQFELDE